MKKYIEINGVRFQEKKELSYTNTHKYLNDCYKNPSIYKKRSFNYWMEFINNLNEWNFKGIQGFNCNKYSIAFTFKYEGKNAIAYITADNNYIAFE